MNNSVQIFEFQQNEIRVTMIDGDPWWVAKDVCDVLGVNDVSKALSRLDDDERGTSSIRTLGGTQEMLIVNEPGLYSLILSSRKPQAKEFKRWLTHEVLPSIRKHGAYIEPKKLQKMFRDPSVIIATLQALQEEQERSKQLEASNKILTVDILAWTDRASLNRAVRLIANSSGKYIGTIWNELYTELSYKHGIGLKKRGKTPYIQHIREEEWPLVQQSLAAICEQRQISAADIYDKAKIAI